MEFSASDGVMCIRLEKRDAEKLGISYHTFTLQGEEERRILRDLLQAAEAALDCVLPHGTLTVELKPYGEEGLCFRIHVQEQKGPRLYRFSDFDALVSAKKAGAYPRADVSVYRLGTAFFLLSPRPLDALSEYAQEEKNRRFHQEIKGLGRSVEKTFLFSGGYDAYRTEDPVRSVHRMPAT